MIVSKWGTRIVQVLKEVIETGLCNYGKLLNHSQISQKV